MLKGIAVSSGIVVGKVYKLVQPEIVLKEEKGETSAELAAFKAAVAKTRADIEKIKERAAGKLKPEELEIFDAHLTMLDDPEYQGQIEAKINDGSNADLATKEVTDMMVNMFSMMDDAYFKERAADIKDVGQRLLCNVLGLKVPDLTAIDEEVIIVASDLTPSDTAQMDKKFIIGFCTEEGGRTSHSAIMARSLEIPAVVGCKGILDATTDDMIIAMDATSGDVVTEPSDDVKEDYIKRGNDLKAEKEALKVLIDQPSISLDGHKVEIAANIGTPKDVDGVINNGGEAVGLYRTEFLYMDSKEDFPDEETQYEAYKAVLERMEGKRVVFRTLDIGGDKKLDYFQFPEELNPFLGYRAIRLCLDRQDIFRTQLRAILRASAYGKAAIMFPMIATVDEFKRAKAIYEEEREKLVKEGFNVADDIEVGMMVEIPASAIMAEKFAKYADFFSIGTNDLTQYTMAADRGSKEVSYLYQPLNPAVLTLIKKAIDAAHKYGKWCGVCGELASDIIAAPILLGLGLDEFSMTAPSILPARKMIRSLNYEEMKDLAAKVLELESQDEIRAYVEDYLDSKN